MVIELELTDPGPNMAELSVEYFKKSKDRKEAHAPQIIEGTSTRLPGEESNQSDQLPGQHEFLPPIHPLLPSLPPKPLIPAALRGVNPERVECRADLMRELQAGIPQNEFNLPIYLYRADLLSHELVKEDPTSSVTADMIAAATTQVDYHHGYPTFRDGTPIWGNLNYEPREAYAAFLEYLDIPGARALHSLIAYPLELVNEYFYLYSWQARARACDMFRVAHHTRLKEQRLMTVEANQYIESERILKKVVAALDSLDPEALAGEGLGALTSAYDRLARVQRAAVGLSASGDGKTLPGGQSIELTFKQIAEKEGGRKHVDDDIASQILLDDPETLQHAQELILKINSR